MHIRPKADSDGPGCLALLLEVHRTDGYPRYLPDDAPRFITPPYESAAWVAEEDGEIVGHVGVHEAAGDPILDAAQRATGLGAEQLAVIARLLVAPLTRRTGLGQALLETATSHARMRGRRAVLDVVQDAAAPIALYEANGWTRLEPLSLEVTDRNSLDLWVYLGPE
ncbi:GNAT family N-acetyltransferase [Nocardioides astragali]|uniref:GNAT family N-acetyltransferase n=1 Tax=Nocardioides astragali TaxID=1776736 RepID=A0ABW2N412_9ACTN|nr:GNAT family N-acetyltransferase [Nocardioides astragali]